MQPDRSAATVDERLHEAGERLMESMRALALELPGPVWDHHRDIVNEYLQAVGDKIEGR